MTCRYADRLAAFADGERDADVEGHVAGCTSCRAELAEIQTLLRGVKDVAPARPREDEAFWTDFTRAVRVGVEDAAAARRRRWRWLTLLAPVAAVATAIALFLAPRQSLHTSFALPASTRPAPVTAERKPPPSLGDIMTDDVEDLDDDQLGTVLAALDDDDAADDDDTPPQNPYEIVEDLGPRELSRVAAAL